jgi:glycosyltransferase involved in cell wall biosynthesis
MEEAFVTFIIPSMAKSSLPNAIKSLQDQTDPRWKAIIGFDHREPTIQPDEKISVFTHTGYSDKGEDCPYCIRGVKSGAGPVRNECVARATTEWVAFLDDDDYVTNDYVRNLALDSSDADAVVFRMMFRGGLWIPREKATPEKLTHGSVGISFATRRAVFDVCRFTRGRGEDFRMLRDIRNAGLRIKISNHLTYLVKQSEVSKKAMDIKKSTEKKLKSRGAK